LLQGEKLSIWRGFACLFQDLDFRVDPGAVLLVQGPNGAGKTTLLRAIAGLTELEAGRLLWQAAPIPETAPAGGPMFAYQGHLPALKRELTAAENLGFYARLNGFPASGLARIAHQLRLTERLDLEVRLLSAGQQRRLALARLLMSQAPVWVLDEPFTNLDAAGRELLHQLVAEHLARQGLAIIAAHQPLDARLHPVQRLVLGEPA